MFDQLNFDQLDRDRFEKVAEQAANAAKDVVYFAVGVAVVTAQKAQEQFSELRRQLEAQVDVSRDQLSTITARVEPQLKAIDDQVSKLEARVADFVEEYGARLPDPAGKVLDFSFGQARDARAQVRRIVFAGADAA